MEEEEKGLLLLTGIILAILAGLVWISRPMWHWCFMEVYVHPPIWTSLVIAIIGAIGFKLQKRHVWRKRKLIEAAGIAATAFFILIFISIAAPLAEMYPQCYLSQNLAVSEIEELPEIDPSVVRIMPFEVSQRYAKDALQYPRFQLGTGDIAFINKTPHWAYGLIPDGVINFFVLKDKGAVYVDMTTSKKNSEIIEKDMEIGEGMGVTDWYKWKLYKKKYWVNYEDLYFVPAGEELYIVVPMVFYEYHWRFPTFYTVPKWGGVALIDSEAHIEFLTPEQALKHPVLKDQKLFPERLSRYYINSFRYINGIINKLGFHEEELKIAEVPGQQSEQPFLVVTKEGLKWFIACEPFGEKTHGIFKVYLIDARTGEIQCNTQPKNELLTGPVKACDYVRAANPIVDWNRMTPIEPIPVTVQKKLYWQVRVVPKDASGIAYTAMVNAETNDVIELKTDKSIRQFIKGEYAEEIPEAGIGEKVTALVIIRENGQEIQRIELFQNQTVEVIPK